MGQHLGHVFGHADGATLTDAAGEPVEQLAHAAGRHGRDAVVVFEGERIEFEPPAVVQVADADVERCDSSLPD